MDNCRFPGESDEEETENEQMSVSLYDTETIFSGIASDDDNLDPSQQAKGPCPHQAKGPSPREAKSLCPQLEGSEEKAPKKKPTK